MKANPRKLSVEVQQELWNQALTHILAYQEAGGHCIPKHHLMIHLVAQMCRHGNARFYHTFVDESLNGDLADLGGKLSTQTFMISVFRRVLFGLFGEPGRR